MAGDHERFEQDAGAYLLGALPPLEAEVFERHLMGCEICREEIERLRPAVDALPRSVQPVDPPASLKSSLMEVVEAEARVADPSAAGAVEPRGAGWLAWLTRALAGVRPQTALALASVALLAGVALGYGLTQGSGSADDRVVAATVDRSRLPGASARITIADSGDGLATLELSEMPMAPRGKVYEVWIERDGDVRPAGALFTVGRDGRGSAAIPGGVDGVSQVMVTREVAGGAPQPTEMPVIRVRV
jgi:anti-sigma-K factor RskA